MVSNIVAMTVSMMTPSLLQLLLCQVCMSNTDLNKYGGTHERHSQVRESQSWEKKLCISNNVRQYNTRIALLPWENLRSDTVRQADSAALLHCEICMSNDHNNHDGAQEIKSRRT